MSSRLRFALLALAACSAEVPATNRFDPGGTGEKAPGHIEGEVYVYGAISQAGFTVTIRDDRSSVADTQTTAASGRFVSAALPPGLYSVEVDVPLENVPLRVAGIEILPGVDVDVGILTSLELPPVGVISGRIVLDDLTLSPASVRVVASRVAAGGVTETLVRYTNALGEYSFDAVRPDVYRVRADRESFTPDWAEVTVGGSREVVRDLTLYPASAVVRFSVSTAQGAVIGAPYTRDRDVEVLMLAFGNVNEMRYSEEASFVEDGVEVAWRPFNASVLLTLSPGEGHKTLHAQFRVFDTVEQLRTEVYAASIVLDETPPVLTSFVLAPEAKVIAGLRVLRGDPTSVPYELAAFDAFSPIAGLRVVIGDAAPATVPYLELLGGEVFSYSATAPFSSGDGDKVLGVQLRDAAGNETLLTSDLVRVDNGAPADGSLTITGAIADGLASTTLTGTTAVALVVDSAGADEMLLANDPGFVGASWQPYFAGPFAWVLLPGDNPAKTVYARFRDFAGNESTPINASIALDTTPPGSATLLLEDGAEYTSAPAPGHTVGVRLAAQGAAEVRLSTDGLFDDEPWGTLTSTTALDLPAPDGRKLVFGLFRDVAGNESAVVSDSVILDTEGPSNAAVVINGGAAFTSSVSVTLELSATGASEMRLSASGALSSEPWVAFAGTAIILLPAGDCGSGECKEVLASFRDAAGNELGAPVRDAIALDTTPPRAPLITTQPTVLNADSVCVSATAASDTFFDRYEVSGGPTSYPDGFTPITTDGCGPAPSFRVTLDQGTGGFATARFENAIRLRAVDLAGNVSVESQVVITEDSVPPPAPVLATQEQFVNADAFSVYLDPSSESHRDATFGLYLLDGGQFTAPTPTAQLDGLTFNLVQGDGGACGDACPNLLQVIAVDAAGNQSPPASVLITEDSLPPAAPVLTPRRAEINATRASVFFADTMFASPAAEATFDHFEIKGGTLSDFVAVCPQPTARCRLPLARVAEPGRFVYRDLDRNDVISPSEIVALTFELVPDVTNELAVRAVDLAGNIGFQGVVSIDERTTTRLTSGPAQRDAPQVFGDHVAFVEDRSGAPAVTVLARGDDGRFGTGDDLEHTAFSSTGSIVQSPRLSSEHLVWVDAAAGAWQLFVRAAGPDQRFGTTDDGAAGCTCAAAPHDKQITTVQSSQPSIWDDRIVYREHGADGGDIVLVEPGACGSFCPTGNTVTRITSDTSLDFAPVVYGDTITFLRVAGARCDLWVVQAGPDGTFNTGDDTRGAIQTAVDCAAPALYAPMSASQPGDVNVVAYLRSDYVHLVRAGANRVFESTDPEVPTSLRVWSMALHGRRLVAGGHSNGLLFVQDAGDDGLLGSGDDVVRSSLPSYATSRNVSLYGDLLAYRTEDLGYPSIMVEELGDSGWLWLSPEDDLLPAMNDNLVAFTRDSANGSLLFDTAALRVVDSQTTSALSIVRHMSMGDQRLVGSAGNDLTAWEPGPDGRLGTADDSSAVLNAGGTIYLAFQARLSLYSGGNSVNHEDDLVTWRDASFGLHLAHTGADGAFGQGDDCSAAMGVSGSHQRASGTRVVWSNGIDVFVREAGAGGVCDPASAVITSLGSGYDPDIEGKRIVYVRTSGSFREVMLLETIDDSFATSADNVLTRLARSSGGLSDLVLDGDWLAWLDYRSFAGEIYLMHIPDRGVQNVSRRPADRQYFDMHGGAVVWTDDHFATQDVWMYRP